MMLLVAGFWPGLALAALLGSGVGWLCGPAPRPAVPVGLLGVVLLLAGMATAGIVPGLAGLWVEGAAGLLGAYVVGCALGSLLRRAA